MCHILQRYTQIWMKVFDNSNNVILIETCLTLASLQCTSMSPASSVRTRRTQRHIKLPTSDSCLKGNYTWMSKIQSPTFSKRSWVFIPLERSVGMGNNCMPRFKFWIDLLLKKYEYFKHFIYFFFKFDFHTQYSSL